MTKQVRYSGWAACTEKETGEALDRMLLEAVQCILEKAQAAGRESGAFSAQSCASGGTRKFNGRS